MTYADASELAAASEKTDVILRVNSTFLKGATDQGWSARGNHAIALAAPLALNTATSKVSLTAFTWAQIKNLTLEKATFEAHFYGYVKAVAK